MPSTGRVRPWQLQEGRRALEFTPESRLVMNDGEALIAAAAAGMGLLQVPDYMAAQELRAGQLVEVLAAYRAPALPISIVYPKARRVTPRLRVLLDALTAVHAETANLQRVPGGHHRGPAPRER